MTHTGPRGYLALVLHAHLPFVRHPESEHVLEERWLFEAITESYIPLLQTFEGLVRDHVDFRVTFSISPTLMSMLADPLLQRRYVAHLDRLIELAERETVRTAGDPAFHPLAVHYLDRFTAIRSYYAGCGGNLLKAFRALQEAGRLEIITCPATHAFLPLVRTRAAVVAQVETALREYERHFGRRPRGMWLPECGFAPGLDEVLKDSGIDYFFVDRHGVEHAAPKPVFGALCPVLTPAGVAAFARDEASSKQVWSAQEGYPGDYDYREYYRDIGFDLDWETIRPYVHPDGIRVHTGIKYCRITGKDGAKEPYCLEWAREKAALHAGHFLSQRQEQVVKAQELIGRQPVVVAPYDAELFGHWWYEGPVFLDILLRKLHFDQDVIRCISPSEYLGLYSDYQVCRLPMSSWGRGGYADVWLRGDNDWVYPALHLMETRMTRLADRYNGSDPLAARALRQAARELMLAQSSDWAFIMDNKTVVDYAVRRTKVHVHRFSRLCEMLENGRIDEGWLAQAEEIDNLFPEVDPWLYASGESPGTDGEPAGTDGRPVVVMLSWEFPPRVVGGLARHVFDLSRALVDQGWAVHVVTIETPNAPSSEMLDGVMVHRVPVWQPCGDDFLHWVFQMNLRMTEAVAELVDAGLQVRLLHAHDWLVAYAARALKERYGIPLIATIHATEHGRNQGIWTETQQAIHSLEWQLTYEAWRVIVCSTAMRHEVEHVFQIPGDKVDVVRNGIDPQRLWTAVCSGCGDPGDSERAVQGTAPGEGGACRESSPLADGENDESRRLTVGVHAGEKDACTVLFVGRLVREKGVQTLIEAIPEIRAACPDAEFVVVGQGPMREELERQAAGLGVSGCVRFTGFVDDDVRNAWLRQAAVAVFPSLYEPFGIVALEAMAAGTPVVVSDTGGLADIVTHGYNGLKMYPGDAHSLATQVIELLKHCETASQLAERARNEIEKYDWHRIAEETAGIYKRVLREDAAQKATADAWTR